MNLNSSSSSKCKNHPEKDCLHRAFEEIYSCNATDLQDWNESHYNKLEEDLKMTIN